MMEYALIGARLGHSYSQAIHNLLADYRYELCAVSPGEMRNLLASRAFRGLNVTIPYKKDVLPYLDEISDEVREVGSANTLVMGADGRLRGYNTDLPGFLYMADQAEIRLTGKKVVILGSGGTSLTAQAAARRRGARSVVVVSRSGAVNYERLYADHADAEIIVNTTPVGMYPDNGVSPVDLSAFPRCEGVLDVIYNPYRTALLLDAQEKGIRHACGLSMLVAQARYAAEHFTGRPIESEKVHSICARMRADTENLLLIGMPGSGKSSVGQAVAQRMNRPFVDMDALIAERAGKSISDIFREDGEEVFRRIETEVARTCGREKGQVIATGGGVVTRCETMRALLQNGEAIFVERPLEALDRQGRPLSTDAEALRAMYAARETLYRRYAVCAIDNGGALEHAVRAAMGGFYEAAHH